MRRALGWLLAAGIAGLALAAALQALVGRDSTTSSGPVAAPPLAGPDVPAAGALTGTILLAGADGCRLATLDLATLRVRHETIETTCNVWVSPDGRSAVVGRSPGRFANGPNAWLADLGVPSELVRQLGIARGTVSWSPDGGRVAWCGEDRTTNVLRRATGSIERYPGCRPAFTGAGDVLTIVDDADRRAVLRNGDVVLAEAQLESGFVRALDGPVQPLGLDQRADGVLAVAVAATPLRPAASTARSDEPIQPGPFGALARSAAKTPPLLRLQLWRGTSLDRVIALPTVPYDDSQARFGDLVDFSPGGHEVAVTASRLGTPLVVLDVRSGRAVLPPTRQLGFSWSPDGTWLALAGDDEIDVYGIARDEPVFRLPLEAFTLSWR